MAGEIDLKVSADIGDLRKQLEQIPGITADQARLMVAELDRGFKRAEKAAAAAAKATKAGMKQAEDATRKAADAGKELGNRFGDVGSGAGKMAGALDMLAPGLGGIGQGMADLADVGEVAAGSLGSFAAPAIGVLAAAALVAVPIMLHMNAAMEAEAEAARVMGLANDFAASEMELQRTAALDLAVATGQMTVEERASADALHTSAQRLDTYRQSLTDNVAAVREAEIRNFAIAEAIGNVIDKLNKLNPAMFVMNKIFGKTLPTATELTTAFAEFIGVTGKLAAAETLATEAGNRASEELKKTNEVQGKAAQAKLKYAAATKAVVPALKEEKVAMDALAAAQGAVEQARVAELTGTQKLTEQLAKLQTERIELAAAGKLTGTDTSKYAAAEIALAQQVTDARIEEELRAVTAIQAYEDNLSAERATAAAVQFEAEKAATAARINAIAQVADVIAQYTQFALDQEVDAYEQAQADREALGENATKAEKEMADKRVEATRNAARKAFLIDKAAKMASAAAATALAIVQALASAPPPYNFIAAGVVGAAGLIQQAVISSQKPSFHAGGFVGGMAPDEQQATVRRGEAVLNPAGRRAMGDDTIRAANAGMGGGQVIMVQQVYRHRVFDSFVADNLRTRGPLSRALGSGSRAGQARS
jgi:hypothetical protein